MQTWLIKTIPKWTSCFHGMVWPIPNVRHPWFSLIFWLLISPKSAPKCQVVIIVHMNMDYHLVVNHQFLDNASLVKWTPLRCSVFCFTLFPSFVNWGVEQNTKENEDWPGMVGMEWPAKNTEVNAECQGVCLPVFYWWRSAWPAKKMQLCFLRILPKSVQKPMGKFEF